MSPVESHTYNLSPEAEEMLHKVLMASLSALLVLAPVALAENTNTGPGMTGSSNTSTGVGTGNASTSTTTNKGITTEKKSGKLGIFRLHKNKQIRRHHKHMRLMKKRSHRK